jgi:long-subunit fatty acid transport protein
MLFYRKGNTMNRFTLRSTIATAALLAATAASAAGFPVASGEFSAPDMANSAPVAAAPKANTATQAQGRTRAEVLAELEAARCRGDLPFDGETGRTFREVFPSSYPKAECR